MPTNIKAFDAGIERHMSRVVPRRMQDQVDAISLGVHAALMMETPVRSGRMKGNWQISFGSPSGGEIDRVDTSPRGVTPSSGAFQEEVGKLGANRNPFQIVWHHNGVPYANYVNDGTERQAAQRLVERVAARFRRVRVAA